MWPPFFCIILLFFVIKISPRLRNPVFHADSILVILFFSGGNWGVGQKLDVNIGMDRVILEPFSNQRHLQAKRHIDLSNEKIGSELFRVYIILDNGNRNQFLWLYRLCHVVYTSVREGSRGQRTEKSSAPTVVFKPTISCERVVFELPLVIHIDDDVGCFSTII